MNQHPWTWRRYVLTAFLTLGGLWGAAAEAAEPAGKYYLEQCIALGMERQPALAAARATLGSSYAGQSGINRLPLFAKLLSRDIPVRRQQASLGVTIAEAGLEQAEWETRYA